MSNKKKPATPPRGKPSGISSTADYSHIEELIETSIGPLIQGSSRKQVIGRVMTVFEHEIYSGVLPHPRHLGEFESICAGSADRIIKMAEDTLSADIDMDKAEQAAEHFDRRLGMYFGFGALVGLIVGAVVCAIHGNTTVALAFLTVGAIGTVGRFISGRRNGNEE